MKELEPSKSGIDFQLNEFKSRTVEVGERIDLREFSVRSQGMPIACYFKPDGTKDNKPSLCFVVVQSLMDPIAVQVSIDTLKPILNVIKEYEEKHGTKRN